MRIRSLVRSCWIGVGCLAFAFVSAAAAPRPNVVLVMMDDLGYGDLSCHGSPFIRTPHLDALHASGVRLTDFHVAPMCSPTRGQLLTGRDALSNGASIIASSRMMVRAEVPMMPAMFAAAGYATALFGKWHLGENHPHRPQDRGFQETLWFPMQEISSLPDHWGNDYFDPVLRGRDGRKKLPGYCTDIFFREAIAWMRRQHQAKMPFLCYLPLNVVHGPQWAPRELREAIAQQFPELNPGQVGYLAMLANADENLGRLETFLAEAGLRENTLMIFLSDNGGYALVGRYNAGMRDGKSRLAEGGHRVPCFVRWPAGGIGGGRDVPGLTQVQDLLPTLLELCGVESGAASGRFDGTSLAKALRGDAPVPDRTLIVQYGLPERFRMTCVMRGRWRLLSDIKGPAKGEPELYDLSTDPLQRTNLISARPEMARQLRENYEAWWKKTEPLTRQRAFISLGHPDGGVAVLNSAEWREGAMHGMEGLRQGVKRRGVWDVEVARDGTYEFALRRWPQESGLALRAAAPAWTPRDTSTPNHAGFAAGIALPIAGAWLRVGERRVSATVAEDDHAAVFRLPLKAGRTEVEAAFQDGGGRHLCPAFFLDARRVD